MNQRSNQIDKITNAFVKHFESLTKEELNWKPNASTWSIAQNIDHLIVINQTYFPLLVDLKAGTLQLPFIAKFGFLVSFFGKMILNSVKPDQKKKIKTFPIWEPSESQLPDDLLERFSKHQNELKQEMEAVKDFIRKGAVIYSPANKNIVYKLEKAFDIIVAHEQRHFKQAKEILTLLKKNANRMEI